MTASYIDVHVLQTIPYANLNRDDLGSPKTMRFGDAERTRVSSQCWKRATRLALEERFGIQAVRTRRVPQAVAQRLEDRGWSPELAVLAGEQVAAAIGKGLALDDSGWTKALLYLPAPALDELADICVEHEAELQALAVAGEKPKTSKKTKGEASETVLPRDRVTAVAASRNPIISLFGRMLAEAPSAHVDGAVQVAHAFTVHDTSPEIDFFTVVDDLPVAEGTTGSSFLDSAEFSAGTFYRYASINLHNLTENLDGDTQFAADLAAGFLDAFITSLPGAKRTSTAPFTIPDLVYIAVRSDRPVSLAAAFEAPVRAPLDGGYAARAREVLSDYAGQVYRLLGQGGLVFHGRAAIDEKPLGNLGGQIASFPALIQQAVEQAGAR